MDPWWVRCGSCFSFTSAFSSTVVYLTSCGHFVCNHCLHKSPIPKPATTGYCYDCKKACSVVNLSQKDKLSPDITFYFKDPVSVLQKMIEVENFQKLHRDRCMDGVVKQQLMEEITQMKAMRERAEKYLPCLRHICNYLCSKCNIKLPNQHIEYSPAQIAAFVEEMKEVKKQLYPSSQTPDAPMEVDNCTPSYSTPTGQEMAGVAGRVWSAGKGTPHFQRAEHSTLFRTHVQNEMRGVRTPTGSKQSPVLKITTPTGSNKTRPSPLLSATRSTTPTGSGTNKPSPLLSSSRVVAPPHPVQCNQVAPSQQSPINAAVSAHAQLPNSTVITAHAQIRQPPCSATVPAHAQINQPPNSQPPSSVIIPAHARISQPPNSATTSAHALIRQPPNSAIMPAHSQFRQPPNNAQVTNSAIMSMRAQIQQPQNRASSSQTPTSAWRRTAQRPPGLFPAHGVAPSGMVQAPPTCTPSHALIKQIMVSGDTKMPSRMGEIPMSVPIVPRSMIRPRLVGVADSKQPSTPPGHTPIGLPPKPPLMSARESVLLNAVRRVPQKAVPQYAGVQSPGKVHSASPSSAMNTSPRNLSAFNQGESAVSVPRKLTKLYNYPGLYLASASRKK